MGGLPNEHIPVPCVPQTEGQQIGYHTLSTSCGVIELPDHHCIDDPVELFSWPRKRFRPSTPDMTPINALEAVVWSNGKNDNGVN